MNPRGAPSWDPEDVLTKQRPVGLLGPRPSDTMIKRHAIPDPEPFREDLQNLIKSHAVTGMGLGVVIAALAVVVTSYADPVPLVVIGLLYLGVGLYYNWQFDKGATA